jgi:hypothetical protein
MDLPKAEPKPLSYATVGLSRVNIHTLANYLSQDPAISPYVGSTFVQLRHIERHNIV